MPAPKPLDPHQSRAAELGAAIRKYRTAKRWTQAELGKAVALSNTAISKFESAVNIPCRDTARRIDDALGANGHVRRLRDHLDDNPDAKWVQKFLHEHLNAAETRQISGFTPLLLETEEHTRLALQAGLPLYGGNLDDKVIYRAKLRQALLRPNPPMFRVVLEEAALHIATGSKRVMRDQLLHLIERSREPNVDLRVLPFEGHGVFNEVGDVTIWDRPNRPPVAFRPSGRSGKFITKREAVADLVGLYDHLYRIALDQEASRTLIQKAAEELYPCARPESTCP
ncbi:helix-turn-helix transcriptional regulator [Streptomyces sp. SAJ15]|uniref:helix-turn-helix domain-containing protein n=1 Tax=Streptomyces sp. SAJ15 TaxID=2011095 RepID=UPI00164344CB|nr:helix-turn-helix transcriptional regulator [Streptomyces sp. SAJ15]